MYIVPVIAVAAAEVVAGAAAAVTAVLAVVVAVAVAAVVTGQCSKTGRAQRRPQQATGRSGSTYVSTPGASEGRFREMRLLPSERGLGSTCMSHQCLSS